MGRNLSWNKDSSPFHKGEQAAQSRFGLKDQLESIGRRIFRTYLPQEHSLFYSQLPFVIVGSIDAEGWPWASIVFGAPGFASGLSERQLAIKANPIAGDPLVTNKASGSPLAFLGIDLTNRRRIRLTGVSAADEDDAITVDVVQTFGNCPQYIQSRSMMFTHDPKDHTEVEVEHFETLDDKAIQLITNSDTFFVASHNDKDDPFDTGGVDVNHRGGRPGFIKLKGDTLTIPDYVGNYSFSTFGNFMINPKAGLLFIDFENGDLLLLTGSAEIQWEMTPELAEVEGAERAWDFKLDHGIRLKNGSPLKWGFKSFSPRTLVTGSWKKG